MRADREAGRCMPIRSILHIPKTKKRKSQRIEYCRKRKHLSVGRHRAQVQARITRRMLLFWHAEGRELIPDDRSPGLKRSNSLSNSLSAVKKHGRKLSLSSLSSALMGRRASTGAVPMSELEEETPLRSDTFDQVVGSGNRSGMKLDRRKSVA